MIIELFSLLEALYEKEINKKYFIVLHQYYLIRLKRVFK